MGVLPLFFCVALFAGAAQRVLVFVVFLVTGVTGGRRFLLRHGDCMAAFALGRFVLA
jgi:hypothetical protein